MSAPLYLGVDLGTSQLKLGVFDASGALVADGRAEYALSAPRPGWVEQDVEAWWAAFRRSLAHAGTQVDLRRVAALAVVAQSPTIVPLDARGVPLRPAVTWADRRSTAEANELGSRTGTTVKMEFEALPRIMWLQRHEPRTYAKTSWFMQAFDLLPYRLTGEPVTVFPHDRLRQWTPERIAAAGLDLDKFPSNTVAPGTTIGTVRPDVAAELGLSTTCRVVSGTVDAFAHWVGVDVRRPGQLCNVGGTSEGASLYSPDPLRDPTFRVFGVPSPFGDGWMVGGSMSNGGSVLDWVARALHGGADRQDVLTAIDEVGAGAGGLVALPYLLGERTPIYDADARGAIIGLAPDHGPAHVGRAFVEGVAYGLRRIIDVLAELGASVDEISVTGGTARSPVWNRIKADVTGTPVRVPVVTDSGVLGAAVLAHSATVGASVADTATAMVRFAHTITPDRRDAAVYDDLYPVFRDLYGHLESSFRRLAELRSAGAVDPSGGDTDA